MVESPSALPKVVQELGLSELELRALGDFLFNQNQAYRGLPRAGICTLNTLIKPDVVYEVRTGNEYPGAPLTVTSFLLHDIPQLGGQIVSIHYRDNLDQLRGMTDRKAGETFLRALHDDLHYLAQILKEGGLRDARMIVGLTTLSAKWGERHGFTTFLYSNDPELIRLHLASIDGLPFQDKKKLSPLTLFLISPTRFIKEFFIKDFSKDALAKLGT
ncbi:hypothetical protein A2165_03195 [Candidatus Curtissbacteria bacterium RBG_13_40_7]|uniref:Uncharacterized protein n=1 Tax=Candidatus Curtissbacteria bacterium RBG_13_40_7 TaxID=1797706 RepID=A0A1F5FYV6_9BACT|nr:MAG: hypothetical protein A2165_03195 [Candidatus Curtissbacteria bacterium RBG_13_40_7]